MDMARNKFESQNGERLTIELMILDFHLLIHSLIHKYLLSRHCCLDDTILSKAQSISFYRSNEKTKGYLF